MTGRLAVLRYMQRHLLSILLALPILPACDDNVDADYKGEPLVSLRGEVLMPADDATPAGDLEVVLAWQHFASDGDYVIVEKVEVGGSFPAAFDLDVYNPPPEATFNHAGEGEASVAVGIIVAVPTGTDTVDEGAIEGVVEGHVLVYAPADTGGDAELSAFLGGPLTAGFHLLQLIPATDEDFAEYEACFEQEDTSGCEYPFDRLAPAPIDTSLNLVLGDIEELDVPNFT